jgi:undecaprenyl-diphosphatase
MFWQKVHQFDQQVTLEINSWDSAFTDPIWEFFSDKYVWAPMYVAIIALLVWRLGWKKGLIAVAAALLTFGFCDQFSNVIKDAVGRLRPVNDEFMIANGLHVLERGGGFSFFSAHAANSFGLAVSTFMGIKEDKRLRYRGYAGWMFFWASMVSISRVFVGKHYLGDILVGIIVGAAAGYAFGALARWIMKKISAKAA